jgi:hypothetical protein
MTEVAALGETGRALTPEECSDLARRAGEAVQFEELLQEGRQRLYELLWRNEHSEAWLVSWSVPRDTGFHDHDGSAGGIYVIEGRVTEEPLVVGRPALVREYGPGQTFAFAGGHIHRMHHDPNSITVHLYSPPVRRLGVYELVDGVLTRTPQSADEETPETPTVDDAVDAG